MTTDYNSYKNLIWKFRRNLQYAANNGKLFPLIGDKEIGISQSMADRLRNDPLVPDHMKRKTTAIHHAFVKFVWML